MIRAGDLFKNPNYGDAGTVYSAVYVLGGFVNNLHHIDDCIVLNRYRRGDLLLCKSGEIIRVERIIHWGDRVRYIDNIAYFWETEIACKFCI